MHPTTSRCSQVHIRSVLPAFDTELCQTLKSDHSSIAFAMKPNTGQPSSSDVQSRSTRVSDRIAEQRERLSKQVDTSQEPLAPKARKRTAEEKQEGPRVKKPALAKSKQPVQEKSTAEGKQRALKPKKPAPAKSRQPVQKKEAKPRHSQVPRVRNIREKALKELERRTANDPLPPDLETVSRFLD